MAAAAVLKAEWKRKSSCLISPSRSSLPIWLTTNPIAGKHVNGTMIAGRTERGRVAVQRQYRHEQIDCPAWWPGRRDGFARAIGDETLCLDRTEPTLNTAIPGDPRDTTTPRGDGADVASAYVGSQRWANPAGAVGDVAQRQYDRRSQHSGLDCLLPRVVGIKPAAVAMAPPTISRWSGQKIVRRWFWSLTSPSPNLRQKSRRDVLASAAKIVTDGLWDSGNGNGETHSVFVYRLRRQSAVAHLRLRIPAIFRGSPSSSAGAQCA